MKSEEERFSVITNRLDDINASLNKANHEIKQLNDKVSSQNLYIKEIEDKLDKEIEDRKNLENRLSPKEKKLAYISFISAIIGGIIVVIFEHLILPCLQTINL